MAPRAAHEGPAAGRRPRRGGRTPPDEASVTDAADAVEDDPADALRAAASAAIAAAAVGAARALARKRYGDSDEEGEEAHWEDAAPASEDTETENEDGEAQQSASALD